MSDCKHGLILALVTLQHFANTALSVSTVAACFSISPFIVIFSCRLIASELLWSSVLFPHISLLTTHFVRSHLVALHVPPGSSDPAVAGARCHRSSRGLLSEAHGEGEGGSEEGGQWKGRSRVSGEQSSRGFPLLAPPSALMLITATHFKVIRGHFLASISAYVCFLWYGGYAVASCSVYHRG